MPPQLRQQPGPYSVGILVRVRAWTVSSWRYGTRAESARQALHALAELAGRADGHRRPVVPDVGPHALSDQLTVLVADALSAGAATEAVDAALRRLADQVGLRAGRR